MASQKGILLVQKVPRTKLRSAHTVLRTVLLYLLGLLKGVQGLDAEVMQSQAGRPHSVTSIRRISSHAPLVASRVTLVPVPAIFRNRGTLCTSGVRVPDLWVRFPGAFTMGHRRRFPEMTFQCRFPSGWVQRTAGSISMSCDDRDSYREYGHVCSHNYEGRGGYHFHENLWRSWTGPISGWDDDVSGTDKRPRFDGERCRMARPFGSRPMRNKLLVGGLGRRVPGGSRKCSDRTLSLVCRDHPAGSSTPRLEPVNVQSPITHVFAHLVVLIIQSPARSSTICPLPLQPLPPRPPQ